jgi:hypothetical protein
MGEQSAVRSLCRILDRPTSAPVRSDKMNKLFRLENGASVYGRTPGLHHAANPALEALSSVAQRLRPRVSLGLKTCQLVMVLLTVAVPLTFAYDFARGKVAIQETAYRRVISLHPGYFEGQPMTRGWARKAIKAAAYTSHWYQCVGEGAVTVFMWTLL